MDETSRLDALPVFLEALAGHPSIYHWRYDETGILLETNCPEHVLHTIFAHSGCLGAMLAHGQTSGMPLVLSARLGVMWLAVFDRPEETLRQTWVLGPVFHSDSSLVDFSEAVRRYEIPYTTRENLLQAIRSIPVISSMTFFHLGILLHFYVTGEKITRSDISSQTEQEAGRQSEKKAQRTRHRTWQAERTLLEMIRTGDLNYRSAMEQAGQLSYGIRVTSSNPVLQAILSASTFTSLCTRAAIEGGLSPDTAYTVGDDYIQQMIRCKTISEVRAINHAMYEDFITRVHRLHQNASLSKWIRACTDYIELHPEEPLTLSSLAKYVGYTEAYLSRRFKQETGVNLRDYIRNVRIERAKLLLGTTDQTIQEISQSLQFCSAGYFAEIFRKVTGELPQQYRERVRPVIAEDP